MPRPLFIPGKDPVLIVQEAGWAPGPVWTGAENLAPTGIWSPDCPARSHSLYRLRYQAHSAHRSPWKWISCYFNIGNPWYSATPGNHHLFVLLSQLTDCQLPALGCWDGSLENSSIIVYKGVNTAVESPSDECNSSSTLQVVLTLFYSSELLGQWAVLKRKRSALIKTNVL